MDDPFGESSAAELEALGLADNRIIVPLQLQEVEPRPVEWLWPGTIPVGKVTVLAGDPGRGKSLITLDIAARVSRGRPWPTTASCNDAPGEVLLFSAEDDAADTIRPRLDASEADSSRIYIATSAGGRFFPRGFELPRNLSELRTLAMQFRSLRLLVLDPLSAFLGCGYASNQGLRSLVAQMQDMAEEHRFAVIFVTHLTKSPAASPIYRAMGSVGMVAAARAVHVCWPDEETPGRCLFVPLKSNLAQALKAYAYSIQKHPVLDAPVVAWEDEPVPLALLSTSTANPIPRVEDARCASWMQAILEEGPLAVSDVHRAARSAGFSRTTLRRAKKSLNVNSHPIGKGGEWEMSLPQPEHGGDPDGGVPSVHSS